MQTKNESNNQLTLFTIGSVIDAELSKVFRPKEIKNNKGALVGSAIGLAARKEIAAALDLKGKDNKEALDKAILEQSDAAWRTVRGEIGKLDDRWTLKKVSNRTTADGEHQISLVLRTVKRRKSGPTDEEISATLGITLEQVREMRARQEAALAANNAKENGVTDVSSTVS